MHTSLTFVSCLLTLTVAVTDYCPKPAELSPCTCDGEGFSCRNAKDENAIRKAMTTRSGEDTSRAMYIQGTPIKRLSRDIFGRFKFVEFHIDVNQITEIESGAFSGSRTVVSTISMYNNKIEKFPFKDVEGLPLLQSLSLARNKLTTIPGPMAFGRHNNLEILHLADNSISRIGKGAFSGLSILRLLDLQGNKLVVLESQVFHMINHHPHLQIGVNNNSIASIAPDAFGSSAPVALSLGFNRLTFIPQVPFKNLLLERRTPLQMTVRGNPLTCQGCSQYQWIVQYKSYLTQLIDGFTCPNRKMLTTLTTRDIGCVGY